ncbi:MAG TPA: FGGY family carbohydrate kinase [Nitriliruptorales bacterium]|nr:FGGY family carbohydrate kinase [Nitriliruptorales bacterium]
MVDEPAIAGLDIGTTNIKAVVFDPRGHPVSSAAVPTPTNTPRPGWTEHDPEELWDAAVQALRDAVRGADPRRVESVAVASMAEAGVPLDGSGRPVHDVIAWFDRRSTEQARHLEREVGADRLAEVTGLRLQPIYGLCKLMWLQQHQPDAFSRLRRWLHVADFIAYRLCGEQATDFSLATRTAALDLGALDWSQELLAAAEIDASVLPPLRWSGTRLATVMADAAEATGLPTSATVATGGHDHICGALAAGVLDPGRALDSMGTAESILVPTAEFPRGGQPARHGYSCGAHVARGRYYVAGGVHAAGASVDWIVDLVGDAEQRDRLLAAAEKVPPGARGACFMPHLRSPDGEVVQRAALFGLTPDLDRATVVRAVLEGLAFAFRDTLEAVAGHAGLEEAPEVRGIGGGARNRLLLRLKATVLGRPLQRLEVQEATSLGAALLGAVGAGLFEDAGAAADAQELDAEEVAPDPEQVEAYQARFREIYGRDYPELRAVSQALDRRGDD